MAVEQPPTTIPLTIASTASLTAAFSMGPHIGGMVIVPSAWTAANIGFTASATSDGTFTLLHDDEGVPIQISNVVTNASYTYFFPTKIFPGLWLKLISKSTTAATVTATNQAAARSLTVILK